MTVSNILLSLLAMDSYNREYGAGVEVSGNNVGAAIFKDHLDIGKSPSTYEAWQSAGFYASTYEVNGEIVISYRGSDDLLDAWNDYLTILGNPVPGVPLRPIPPQVALALQFYDAVKALTMQAERHQSKSGVARLPQLGIVSNWNRGFTGDFRLAA